MNKNDCFKLKITDMGVDGEGIGKYDGMTFFVKDALIGDEILARALKLKKNYGYARVEEILTPSPYRVEPKCPIHRQCGGCQIQALSYEKQLEFKGEKVRNNLLRIGGFSEEELDQVMEPTVGMDEPYRYRNKAQFPVGKDKEGNLITGFYASRTHSIIPVTDCLLGVSENEEILLAVKNYMQKNHIEPYDEKTGKGLIRHVLIRFGFTTKEIMVCLIINGTKLQNQKDLIDALTKIDGMTSISFNVNTRNTNVILGDRTECIWGQSYITDYIHLREGKDFTTTDTAIAYRISPQSFYQVNPEQTEKLYSLALEYAGLTGQESVWDLYCGIGTISLFLAQKAKQVYGVEIVPQAIEDARNNASINGITNAEFFVGKAEEVLPEFYESHKGKDDTMSRPDVIVVDPPRKGCDRLCLDTILKMQPVRVVYVSCDSATLARDLRILCDGGYELKKVRPVDQFAHTGHVESVVLLSQQKADDYLEVEIDLDELDATSAETKATYEEIKKYVAEHNDGMKVSNLYIAQVKKKCGIELGQNFNLPKSENAKQPQCPKEKEDAIVEALKAFQMI
ncbi:23S rRNA (uracil(1939)-C(5))-methyltransferase RlmD [Roseburia sp. MUC/MUC-530-WT-4D]|uniref:23S rRNA (Uracil(1939)-C(5))-methyltransferase RlmD n=1 Tax=Roseburia porci TaxID=2605790 RepID=A0A6L5YPK1_9FIRM|nr:23S rRNA (uracil(1939)-C(5))-methyltransferase RlmD [Roseburia porci]MST74117.1 23S rRNA (uracil(1939)-C(5))-methyltransferase RlmD [Roseburia porci]